MKKHILDYLNKIVAASLSFGSVWLLWENSINPHSSRQSGIFIVMMLGFFWISMIVLFSFNPRFRVLDTLMPASIVNLMLIVQGFDNLALNLEIFFCTLIFTHIFYGFLSRSSQMRKRMARFILSLPAVIISILIAFSVLGIFFGDGIPGSGFLAALIAPFFLMGLFIFPFFAVSFPVFLFSLRKTDLVATRKMVILAVILLLWLASISETFPIRSFIMKKIDPCYGYISGKGFGYYIIDDGVCMSGDTDAYGYSITKTLEGADSKTFKKVGGGMSYFRDKNNLYYGREIMDADKDTFIVLDRCVYAKDKNNVYYGSGKIDGLDTETFQCVEGNLVKDKNGCYRIGLVNAKMAQRRVSDVECLDVINSKIEHLYNDR